MLQQYLLGVAFLAALLASIAVTPSVIRLANRNGWYDQPGGRRIHKRPVPRLGGLAVFAATLAGFIAAAGLGWRVAEHHREFLVGILVGGAVLFTTGVVDDLRGLRPRTKLLAQMVAAGLVYAMGFRIEMLSFWPTSDFSVGWLSLPLTLLWVVGVTNAFNLIDGLDGLATGIAIVALSTTLAAALMMGRADVAITAAALLGSLVGFLAYNFNPARIFLGDSGSLFVGFMLAVLSVHGSTKSSTAVLAIVPLLALGLPLADTGLAMARRWLRGAAFSSADGRHIHHRLLATGLTQRRSVLVLYVVSAALASIGVLAVVTPPEKVLFVTAAGSVLCLVLLLAGMRGLDYHEFAEAGAVLSVAPAKFRRVIRDRIHARDVAQVLSQAESLKALNAILGDNAETFGFAHMQVRSSAGVSSVLPGRGEHDVWWVVRPLARPCQGEAPLALVIWCGREFGGSRPFGVERVAAILVPALVTWLTEKHLIAAAVPQVAIRRVEAEPDEMGVAV